jgi:NADH:ubiquinone oxidoreductase subunit E
MDPHVTPNLTRLHLMVCAGTGCVSNHSFELKTALEAEIRKHHLENEVSVVPTGCNGFCERGPILVVQPGNIFYQQLAVKDVPHLV